MMAQMRGFALVGLGPLTWLSVGCQYLVPAMLAQGNKVERTALPAEDGTMYVSVRADDASPVVARSLWRQHAKKACEGDYMVLSEMVYERRSQGNTSGRTHEGYVRCVSPEADKPIVESD